MFFDNLTPAENMARILSAHTKDMLNIYEDHINFFVVRGRMDTSARLVASFERGEKIEEFKIPVAN